MSHHVPSPKTTKKINTNNQMNTQNKQTVNNKNNSNKETSIDPSKRKEIAVNLKKSNMYGQHAEHRDC